MAKHMPKKYFDESGHLIIKPYRMKDLCRIFDLNYRTMRSMINPYKRRIGKRKGQYYNVDQVNIIVQSIGIPSIHL